jgi:hypothetical protein
MFPDISKNTNVFAGGGFKHLWSLSFGEIIFLEHSQISFVFECHSRKFVICDL